METHFAPALKADALELQAQIEAMSSNPVIDGLLRNVAGLLAILNEQRQILAVNEALLAMLGIRKEADVLGLRPGEAIACVHAQDPPAGCGTTRFCASCGAAIAIVVSLGFNRPEERTCAMSVRRGPAVTDLYLRVRAAPIALQGKRYLLLFLQDNTAQQRWAAMEKAFFHDLGNMVAGVVGTADLLLMKEGRDAARLTKLIHTIALRIAQEIAIQALLCEENGVSFQPLWEEVAVAPLFEELRQLFASHPTAAGKDLAPAPVPAALTLRTDASLLRRILVNMLVNAFEASERGEEVRLKVDREEKGLVFSIWNRQQIPGHVALRIFQRHFSTKAGPARGLGTYSMKLFGEQFLGGKLDFTTSATGTTFRLVLPPGEAKPNQP